MLSKLESYFTPRWAFMIAGGVSAALLGGAHAFENFGGLEPCLLCLEQREIHWTALTIAFLGTGASFFVSDKRIIAAVLAVLTAVFLWSTIRAGFHAGVEWDFWDGPMACAGGTPTVDPGNISLDSLQSSGLAGPPCEVAAWRMLGISMAGYNALISLALAAFTGAAAWRLVKDVLPAKVEEEGAVS
ncbi:disulfide bond formation protein B [Parvularcula marina]|uniref:Disulfide bond formation protein B n=1 Tax=Parvularcula marina TaxID=2292771 RepID=A0A371RGB8_9PROT|nr:disulfide bond formation protein B [Parvularcula marina]RFB04465.1 disulfide bond formation protein B [Parvularcula marina]